MSSKINNLGIIKALGESLNIIDSKQGPTQFKTDEMVATVEVSPGWASYEPFHVRMGGGADIVSLNGENSIDLPLIASDPTAYTNAWGGESQCLINAGREYVILGIRFALQYSITSTPDAGKELYFGHFRRYDNSNPNTAIDCGTLETWKFVRSSLLTYEWSFPFWSRYTTSGNPFESWQYVQEAREKIWVPAGCDFGFRMGGATPFPITNYVQCQFWGVSCPKGLRPPLC